AIPAQPALHRLVAAVARATAPLAGGQPVDIALRVVDAILRERVSREPGFHRARRALLIRQQHVEERCQAVRADAAVREQRYRGRVGLVLRAAAVPREVEITANADRGFLETGR